MTPAASDSPADAAVCTKLFSNIFDCLKRARTPMDITAAGIEADIVIPANKPRYAMAPDINMDSSIPRIIALKVISFFILVLFTKG